MTTIPELPLAPQVGASDLLPLSQAGTLYAVTVGQLTSALQPEITVPTGDLLGRVSAGPGAPEAVGIGTGLMLAAGGLAANGADHAGFPVKATFSLADEVVLSSGGKPALIGLPALRGLFSAGTGLTIDDNGMIAVTVSAIAGPAGPQGVAGPAGPAGPAGAPGAQGAGLVAPNSANSASAISASDYVAIWQNGSNAWITYQQLIGGQTIDQLPAAGPARDSDELLVAQGGNSLSSQSFAAIWTYIGSKLPTLKFGIVELTANTVLDGTTHNGRVLVASQPLTLSANFANMGPGFSCRIINLSAGAVSMGTGISAGNGATILPPGSDAELTGISYSGGSLVWWSGVTASAPTASTITVAPITTVQAETPFTVSGNIFNDAPTALDYSTDATNWIAAQSPAITAGNYSFSMPGLPAGTYTLQVRDHNNIAVIGTSNSFIITAASITLGTVPNSIFAGTSITATGSVVPAGAAVQIGFSTSATIPPASFSSAAVNGGNWSGSITAPVAGTAYLWARQSANTSVQAVSSSIIVAAPSLTVSAPGSGIVGNPIAVTGTLTPAGGTVNVQLATQNSTVPSGNWTAATVFGSSFSASLTPAAAGTYYVWAQDQSNGLNSVSSAIAVSVAAQPSVSYTVNQPGTTSYAAGSGTIALNSGISPAQNIETQVALSASNAVAPTTGWQAASIIDNNALWAVYVAAPATAGSYYVWVETASGGSAAVSSFSLALT